jgi:hypothetical protein
MKPQVQLDKPLTADQIAEVRRIGDEWFDIGLSTERCDRPAAEAAVRAAYRAAKIEEPRLVVWMESPLGGVFAAAMIKDLGKPDSQLGGQLGGQLGDQLGDQLWDQLWDQLGDQLGDQLWDQLRGQLGDQLWDQLGGQLGGQLGDQLGDQLRGQLRGQLGDQLWDQLGGQLRGQLWDQLGLELSPWWDAYWLAYYTCALPLAGLDNSPRLETLVAANRLLGWWWPMRGAAVLTDRPTILSRDQQGRLHNERGPALAYADGYAYHGWHGTRVPADLIETGWDIERIMAERNAEVRRCAIERMGWDQFVTAAELTLADEADDPGNPGQVLRLYDVPRTVLDLPVRVLVCVNATRERDGSRHTFGLTVPTDCKTAIAAAAWSFGVTAKEYRQLVRAC